jgi:hypothetical protein
LRIDDCGERDGPYAEFAHIPRPAAGLVLISNVAVNALYRPRGRTSFRTSEDDDGPGVGVSALVFLDASSF